MLQANTLSPQADDDLDIVFDRLRARVRGAILVTANEIGGLVADELIQQLNTPYPPASKPGTDPHRRTGNLSAGIAHHVYEIGNGFTIMVTSSRAEGDENVPTYLEFGTEKMGARGYMTRTAEDWATRFEDEAARVFKQAMGL